MVWDIILNSSLVGSLVGTTIAGLVAIYVMRRQLKHDSDIKRKGELNFLINVTTKYCESNNVIINYVEKALTSMNKDDSRHGFFQADTRNLFAEVPDLIHGFIEEIHMHFNYSNAPADLHYFISLSEKTGNCIKEIMKEIKHDMDKHTKTDHFYMAYSNKITDLEKDLEEFKKINDKLLKKRKNYIKEYKRINSSFDDDFSI